VVKRVERFVGTMDAGIRLKSKIVMVGGVEAGVDGNELGVDSLERGVKGLSS
jgi:hypothetical protein